MGDALEHGDLFSPSFSTTDRHIGFLIPRED
jgi:hypothetical protein